MYEYKLFIDSIVLKINYHSYDKQYDYNNVIEFLSHKGYKNTKEISNNYIAKFKYMYLVRDQFGNNLLDVFTFSSNANNKSIFFVYALKYGIYIEINGLVQYENDYRHDKFNLLTKVWNKYDCSINKLDIAIDVETKFDLLKIYNNKSKLLNKSKKSKKNIHYFMEGSQTNTNKQRKLKAYYKSTQRYREFPLAMDLSRIELTLKTQKLKSLTTIEDFSNRVSKEFNCYIFKIDQKDLILSKEEIKEMFKSLFSVLNNGKNSKKYANFYKNIDTKIKSMKLAWKSLSNNISVQDFVKNNAVAATVLKKYRKFYKKTQIQ